MYNPSPSAANIIRTVGLAPADEEDVTPTVRLWMEQSEGSFIHQQAVRLVEQLRDVEDEILAGIAALTRTLDETAGSINTGFHINELGVVQRQGPDLDRLAARRQQLVSDLTRTARAISQGA